MIYTFYSYKGGVGRSMAMANVAKWIHLQGKRVIMIDWDLEAPGLEGYFFPEEQLEQIKSRQGIMDILTEYKLRYNKFNREMIRRSQETEAATRRLVDRLMKTEINWPLIEENFATYAAFDKREIADIISQLTALNQKKEINISEIFHTIQPYLSNQELADEFSIHISDKLQNGKLDPEEVEVYLSTYSLFKKNDIEKIIIDLKSLVEKGDLNNDNVLKLLQNYLSQDGSTIDNSALFSGLVSFKDLLYEIHPPDPPKNNGLWLLPAGRRDGENFTAYSKTVQDFNWTEFYSSYNGENYFEWFRKQLESMADIIFIDSRTGVSEMSGVSTRHLADVIVIVTAPNPQNLTGITKMIKSFIHKDLEEKRQNRKLSLIIVPSRVDVSESLLRNQFQAKFYRTSDEVLGNNLSKDFWELGIPYIPYYNYKEELAVGLSDNPDDLEASPQSRELDRAYRKLASYLVNGTFESQTFSFEKPSQPFIGLKPFQPEDASLFFGRNNEISRMLEIIFSKGFLVLCGPTGSGKSSILRAGLIPSLKNNTLNSNLSDQAVIFFKPGADPFVSLAEAVVSEIESDKDKTDLKEKVEKLSRLFIAFPENFTQNIKDVFGVERKCTVIIDQFEDLFTLCSDEQKRDKFIYAVSAWISGKKTTTILSVRSDYYLQLSTYSLISEQLEGSLFNLETPSERELRQIIVEPAAKAGIKVEQGLVERILKDLETVNNKLAVLQLVLYELWSNRNGNLLTHAAYDKINRTDGVLKQMYEGVYKLFSQKELEAARPLITRLVNIENNTRQALNFDGIDNEKRMALKPFIDKGLLIIDRGKKAGFEKVELANDLLISSWPQLNEWISNDREFLLWRQQLDSKLDIWRSSNGLTDFLLNKTFTAEAQKWLNEYPNDLTEDEKRFIKKSIDSRAKQKRTSRVINIAVLVVIVGMLIFIMLRSKTSTSAIETPLSNSDSAKAYTDFVTTYTTSELQYDLNFNLKMIQQYYKLDKKYRDTLQNIKQQIEQNIAVNCYNLIDTMYASLKKKNFSANTFFSDTLTFGVLKNVTAQYLQSRIDSIVHIKSIRNVPIDSTFQFKSDSLGFYVTFHERGNILIDKLQEYESFQNLASVHFTPNLRIKSLTYKTQISGKIISPSIYSALQSRKRVDLFVCTDLLKGDQMNLKNIIGILNAEKYNVVTRNFRNPPDALSPYHVSGNEIRYFGNEEYRIALSLQKTFLYNRMDFKLKPVRISTPNVISVFVCEDFYSKSLKK